MTVRKGEDPEGSSKEPGGAEGEENIIRIYFMRKESICNEREN